MALCIPSDKASVTDDCGCCADSGYPTAPEGGFLDEDTQLFAAALEVPKEVAFHEVNGTSGSGASAVTCGGDVVMLAAFFAFAF